MLRGSINNRISSLTNHKFVVGVDGGVWLVVVVQNHLSDRLWPGPSPRPINFNKHPGRNWWKRTALVGYTPIYTSVHKIKSYHTLQKPIIFFFPKCLSLPPSCVFLCSPYAILHFSPPCFLSFPLDFSCVLGGWKKTHNTHTYKYIHVMLSFWWTPYCLQHSIYSLTYFQVFTVNKNLDKKWEEAVEIVTKES